MSNSMRKFIKWGLILILLLAIMIIGFWTYIFLSLDTEALPENHGQVNTELYVGLGEQQPLIVGLGGSEGGNAWASDYWANQRNEFIDEGYAFLAIGYFGMTDTPNELDRIALEGVHEAIVEAKNHPQINGNCVAVMGGSKGGELALTLGSYYDDIKAVVGIVPGHAVFTGLTLQMTTSSFTYEGESLPFVPVPWRAVPPLFEQDLRTAFEIMLEDEDAVEKAAIQVENINGPIFLISGTEDEFWPSSEMSDLMIERLTENDFPYHYEHVAIEGGHAAPLDHFDQIMAFLNEHFLAENTLNCPRP